MNPAEFYESVASQFPSTWPTDPEWVWVNVHDGQAPKLEELRATLDHYLRSAEVVVLIHSEPGVGATLAKEAASSFIAEHVLKYEIQASDPAFQSFVLVSSSGVATGWSRGYPASPAE